MSKQLSVRKPKQIQTKGNMHSNLSFLSSTTQTITKLFIFKLRTAESGALNKEKKLPHARLATKSESEAYLKMRC